MCADPVTMMMALKTATAAIGTTLGTAGTALTVGGGILSAYTQMQNAKSQAKAAEMTAVAQEEAARQSIEQGNDESDRQRRIGAIRAAENTTAFAANGVDVGSVAALDVLDDAHTINEEDAFTIRENARRTATGQFQSAANARTQASAHKSDAFFAPVQTLLSTASKVGRKYAPVAAKSKKAYS